MQSSKISFLQNFINARIDIIFVGFTYFAQKPSRPLNFDPPHLDGMFMHHEFISGFFE